MPTAKQLPSGNWRAEGCYSDENGRRVRKSFTASDKITAEYLAREFARQRISPERGSFSEAVTSYIKSSAPVLSPYTIKAYKAMSKMLQETYPEFCRMKIDEIQRRHFQAVINDLAAKRAPKTVRNYYSLITVVLKDHDKEFTGIKLPQKEKPKLTIPDTPTVKKIIQAVDGTPLQIPVVLAVVGTMRCGEICALRMEDIQGNSIHIHRSMVMQGGKYVEKPPKTYASDRIVELPAAVVFMIRQQGYVTKLTPNAVTKRFERMLVKEKLPHCRFHDLRHYSASRMHAMGIPTAEIMKRGGWSSETTLIQVYRHALDSEEKARVRKINKQFAALL